MRIKDIALKISSGSTPSRNNTIYWKNGTINWIKSEQLNDYYINSSSELITEKALMECHLPFFNKNTILVAMYGEGKTRGNVSLLKIQATTNQAVCGIVVNEDIILSKYLFYYLQTQYENLRRLSSGVRNNLNIDLLKNYPIKYISKNKQFRIVDIM